MWKPLQIAGRVRGTFAGQGYGDGDEQQLHINQRGDLLVAQGLPELAEICRHGDSWQASTATQELLTAKPNTVAGLSIFNGEPATGKCYVIDTIGLWGSSLNEYEYQTALFAMNNKITNASVPSVTSATIASLLGRGAYDGHAVFANALTVVNDGWFPHQGIGNGPTTTAPTLTTTETSGSGTFTVTAYSTLTVEIWGPGGSGATYLGSGTYQGGLPGSGSNTLAFGSTTMTANSGAGAPATALGGAGGAATGGNNTNTTGTAGSRGLTSGVGGNGGAGANGGAGGTGSSGNGGPGTAPGGGGAGAADADQDGMDGGGGGGGGGYSKSVFTYGVTSGYPAFGSTISWSVPTGGVHVIGESTTSGAGAAGQVKFTLVPAPTQMNVTEAPIKGLYLVRPGGLFSIVGVNANEVVADQYYYMRWHEISIPYEA